MTPTEQIAQADTAALEGPVASAEPVASDAQRALAPIAVSIENAGDWGQFAAQLTAATGVPTVATPELLSATIASAVPLLFEADAARAASRLRGTFADAVIAQCQRNAGALEGARPLSVSMRLVGTPHTGDARAALRVHLAIAITDAAGAPCAQRLSSQFWDLELGGEATVGEVNCPNCGAPLARGELLCGHCGADARSVVAVPLLVSRLELY
jgi:hypothetical protein